MDQLNQAMGTHSATWSPAEGRSGIRNWLSMLSTAKYELHRMLPVIQAAISSGHLTFDSLPRVKGGYSRTILYREPTGFEVMAARWDKGAETPIHGHPDFSLVYLIEGELWEDSFKKSGELLMETGSQLLSAGDYACERGTRGSFDNFIHRISALKESVSLHIYSDDAIKGEIFTP